MTKHAPIIRMWLSQVQLFSWPGLHPSTDGGVIRTSWAAMDHFVVAGARVAVMEPFYKNVAHGSQGVSFHEAPATG